MSAARRTLSPDAEARVAAAGVRSWPVSIRVNRTTTATGVTVTHHHASGALAAFVLVGEPIDVADRVVETPDGPVVVPGLASAVLAAFESANLRKVA